MELKPARRLPMLPVLLFFLTAGFLHAQEPIWPGPAFLSASSWEGAFAVPLSAEAGSRFGFGAKAGFFAEGIKPLKGLGAGIALSYAWLGTDGTSIIPILGASSEFSWRIPIAGIVSARPKLEVGAAYSPSAAGGSWSMDLAAGFGLSLLLGGRNYLTISPAVRWTPDFANQLAFSVSVGTRTETVWMKKIPLPVLEAAGVPSLYSPDDDGTDDVFNVRLGCENGKQVASWSISILDGRNEVFLSRSGALLPPKEYSWDGVSNDGRLVDPASDYRFVFTVEDILGRKTETSVPFTVDILVIKMGSQYKIRVPAILFPSNSADLAGTEWMVSANKKVLGRLVTLFARFPDYSIVVEGHANSLYWQNADAFSAEQKNELVPLSQSRAESVRKALVSLGIASGRIKALGVGGTEPIVSFSDTNNAWKNRRVEFILVKNTEK